MNDKVLEGGVAGGRYEVPSACPLRLVLNDDPVVWLELSLLSKACR